MPQINPTSVNLSLFCMFFFFSPLWANAPTDAHGRQARHQEVGSSHSPRATVRNHRGTSVVTFFFGRRVFLANMQRTKAFVVVVVVVVVDVCFVVPAPLNLNMEPENIFARNFKSSNFMDDNFRGNSNRCQKNKNEKSGSRKCGMHVFPSSNFVLTRLWTWNLGFFGRKKTAAVCFFNTENQRRHWQWIFLHDR